MAKWHSNSREEDFLSDPKFSKHVERACEDIQNFWKANVKNYFSRTSAIRRDLGRDLRKSSTEIADAHEPQMPNACRVSVVNNRITVFFTPIISEDGKDYGNFLIDGTSMSPGVYSPVINARLKDKHTNTPIGFTRGVSKTYWERWASVLDAFIDKRIDQLLDEIVEEIGVEDVMEVSVDKGYL